MKQEVVVKIQSLASELHGHLKKRTDLSLHEKGAAVELLKEVIYTELVASGLKNNG